MEASKDFTERQEGETSHTAAGDRVVPVQRPVSISYVETIRLCFGTGSSVRQVVSQGRMEAYVGMTVYPGDITFINLN